MASLSWPSSRLCRRAHAAIRDLTGARLRPQQYTSRLEQASAREIGKSVDQARLNRRTV